MACSRHRAADTNISEVCCNIAAGCWKRRALALQRYRAKGDVAVEVNLQAIKKHTSMFESHIEISFSIIRNERNSW